MEPITFILTALTLGIAAGFKSTAEQAVKDVYAGLKTLIQNRYNINLGGLEQKPDSEAQFAAVEESLRDAKADKDTELLDKAKELLDVVKRYDLEVTTTKAVKFVEVEAAYIEIRKMLVEGSSEAVTMEGVKTTGGITIEDITTKSAPKVERQ